MKTKLLRKFYRRFKWHKLLEVWAEAAGVTFTNVEQ